jgi:hypothetical protein
MANKKPLSAGDRVKYSREFMHRMAYAQNSGIVADVDGALVRVLWRGENEARPINAANIERAPLRAKAAPKAEAPATIEAPAAAAPRRLSTIAREIRRAWPRVYFAAAPYLDAMQYLDNINDKYLYDDARSIVRYFLANAATFKGDAAKALKAELKALIK